MQKVGIYSNKLLLIDIEFYLAGHLIQLFQAYKEVLVSMGRENIFFYFIHFDFVNLKFLSQQLT